MKPEASLPDVRLPNLLDIRGEARTQPTTSKAPGTSPDKSAKDKAEPAKPAASLKDLPVDVFSSKPDTAKEKAPR